MIRISALMNNGCDTDVMRPNVVVGLDMKMTEPFIAVSDNSVIGPNDTKSSAIQKEMCTCISWVHFSENQNLLKFFGKK